jgi:hypothetical protein
MAQPNLEYSLSNALPLLDESLQRFLPQLYDVQLGSGSWEPLLHEIKDYLKARAVALVSHDFIHNLGSFHSAIGTVGGICNRMRHITLIAMYGWTASAITDHPAGFTLARISYPSAGS